MSREGTPRKRRQWIKLWTAESLRGSIRFDLTPAERGVWYDLLALAGESRTPGIIQATEGVAYPRPWLAQTLNIPLELLDQTLDKLKKTERVELNGDCIHISNFEYYQARRVEEEEKVEGRRKTTYPDITCSGCHYCGPDVGHKNCPVCGMPFKREK